MRVVICTNTADFFLSHRLALGLGAKAVGCQVTVMAPPSELLHKIQNYGFDVVPLEMDRKSLNPFSDLCLILRFVSAFRQIRPDVYHGSTIKPVIYGGIAAWFCGVPRRVATVTGLGYVFIQKGLMSRVLQILVGFLYRFSLWGYHKVIFKNRDDQSLFIKRGWVVRDQAVVILGAGVDIRRFKESSEPEGEIRILFPARFLIDKGIRELVAAGRKLARDYRFKIVLCGKLDPGNPQSINKGELQTMIALPFIENRGYCPSMDKEYRNCHIVCLPSYREGLSQSLVEAASCGRPIVTTDAPGCRDAVLHDQTGLLVPVQDSEKLYLALRRLMESPDLRRQMGLNARQWAVENFSTDVVIPKNLQLYGVDKLPKAA